MVHGASLTSLALEREGKKGSDDFSSARRVARMKAQQASNPVSIPFALAPRAAVIAECYSALQKSPILNKVQPVPPDGTASKIDSASMKSQASIGIFCSTVDKPCANSWPDITTSRAELGSCHNPPSGMESVSLRGENARGKPLDMRLPKHCESRLRVPGIPAVASMIPDNSEDTKWSAEALVH
ncbi:hypothetical protein Cob_v006705 [Colletotrichum orbiculare MAFF 240422]|uniref:Uncharacterized protein n=1 Tax=Colletotrichum orbiculare (strain 104-T / ATCC 96160 / CBS 514.97 / LARS 414 / MAFF 240422) TaxID=1213857 RepID=A0A484FRX8_COLOR|nr:hypothetical protein Cob_v006705 [Colletotrichum orbiculare MAFF 240422]